MLQGETLVDPQGFLVAGSAYLPLLYTVATTLKDEQKLFIENELLKRTLQGAFQRINIYMRNVSEGEKSKFRDHVHHLLRQHTSLYTSREVRSDEHIRNIERFHAAVCEQQPVTFQFGVSQKLFNLFLKYRWCVGELKCAPPHCPIDRGVLAKIHQPQPRWSLLTRAQYERRIGELAKAALPLTVAEWEIRYFNGANTRREGS